MTKIKICGLFRPEDIDAVNDYRPDYAGFVLAPGSRRTVSVAQARALSGRLAPGIRRVGVFTTNSLTTIQALVQTGVIQIVQLHGPLNDPRVAALQAAHVPVIQAVTPADSARTRADFPLLDNRIPGSGRVLPWTSIHRPVRPFFLAGGLTPTNVCQAIKLLDPAVIDVSSGVETNHLKDPLKIKAMIRSVHHDQN